MNSRGYKLKEGQDQDHKKGNTVINERIPDQYFSKEEVLFFFKFMHELFDFIGCEAQNESG